MRFVFTLNLPSSKGNLVQQVIGDHNSRSLNEMLDTLANAGWICVAQYYSQQVRGEADKWEKRGEILLNCAMIGKVSPFVDHSR